MVAPSKTAPQAAQPKEPTVQVPLSVVNLVLGTLGEMPLKVSHNAFMALSSIAQQQLGDQPQG